MDIFFLYQHYRTRGIIDEEETLNSRYFQPFLIISQILMLRNIYDRTFYLLLQSSCFKERLQSGFRPSEIRLKRCVNTKLSE